MNFVREGFAVGGASALNAAVMRCLERVVALPDPKNEKNLAESSLFSR